MLNKLFSQDIPFRPQITLLATNLIPLIGVLFFGWQVSTLLAVYWAESGVIGFYTVLKMIRSEKLTAVEAKDKQSQKKLNWWKEKLGADNIEKSRFITKLFLVPFFIFHFGMFMLGHGVFLFVFISKFSSFEVVNFGGFLVAVLGLMISHGVSYYQNYIQQQEYKQYSPRELMGMPYSRIILMHLVIVFSGFLTLYLSSFRMAALLLMVVLKIIFDLKSHIKEHS
ncbi:MAG: DUF6498-containing protein [Candidatus Paceibacteria bacterium]